MAFLLVMKDGPHTALSCLEERFEAASVSIGRGASNDIVLPDSRRLVSSKHAEIQESDGQYWLVDVGSKNGMNVNDQPVLQGRPHLLNHNDQISIGTYLFEFHQVDPMAVPGDVGGESDATVCVIPESAKFDRAVEQLRMSYRAHLQDDSQTRISMFTSILHEVAEGLDATETQRFLSYVEATFPDPEIQQEYALNDHHRAHEMRQDDVRMNALHADRLSSSFFSETTQPLTAEERIRLSQRVEAVLTILLDSLVEGVQSRRKFKEEMEIDVTRLMAKEPNPIKWAQSKQEMGTVLFNIARSGQNSEKILEQLRETLDDLAMHPLGVMSGLQECLHGLLQQLDPQMYMAEVKEGRSSFVAWFLQPLFKSMAWDRYSKNHQKLLQEEIKTIKTLLNAEFEKGYLRVYAQQSQP